MGYDFLVVGGGILGLCVSLEVKGRFPESKVAVFEKEEDVGLHATGRSSGVLHAGFYYSPDSFKAKFSVEGARFWREWCREKGVKILEVGKVVVAQSEDEVEGIFELEERGKKNGVEVYVIRERELAELEPNAKTVEVALWSPRTAVVDPKEVVKKVLEECKSAGIEVFLRKKFFDVMQKERKALFSDGSWVDFGFFINCAGAWADRIAHKFGVGLEFSVLPFKGTYFYTERQVVRRNVYPVPDLKYPFLGVHLTPSPDGKVYVGPTVLPAFSREDYSRFLSKPSSEVFRYLKFLLKLFLKDARFRRFAFREVLKWRRKGIWKHATRMVKNLSVDELEPSQKVGIRPQIINTKKLELVDDFVIERTENSLHIINTISPAFTSAPAIAKWVVEKIR